MGGNVIGFYVSVLLCKNFVEELLDLQFLEKGL